MMSSIYVYIDDTSFAGNSEQGLVDKSTVLWTAVILKEKQKQLLEECVEKLLDYFRVSEFHFKEIYGGRGEFANFSFEDKLKIVECFVALYNKYRPMCLIGTCDKNTLSNTGFSDKFQKFKIDGFSFEKPKDYSLYVLLLNIQRYIKNKKKKYKQYRCLQIRIIIDEGRQKVGSTQKIVGDDVDYIELQYESSQQIKLLQFADFLAFVSNRIVTNIEKERKTEFDKAFMQSVGRLRWRSNIQLVKINASELDNLKNTYIRRMNEIEEKVETPSKEMMRYLGRMVRIVKYSNVCLKTIKRNKHFGVGKPKD